MLLWEGRTGVDVADEDAVEVLPRVVALLEHLCIEKGLGKFEKGLHAKGVACTKKANVWRGKFGEGRFGMQKEG